MYTACCKLCGVITESEFSGRPLKKMNVHLMKVHTLTPEQYLLQTEYQNIYPTCACGCGQKVRYEKWFFRKYVGNHKNTVKISEETKNKIREAQEVRRYKRQTLSLEEVQKYLDLYKDPNTNMRELHKILPLDLRVMKKCWIERKLITSDDFKKWGLVHKYRSKPGRLNGSYKEIKSSLLVRVFEFVSEHKGQYAVSFILDYFHIKESAGVLLKRLREMYGEEKTLGLFRFGNRSNPEISFSYILKYYFGEKNIREQIRLDYKFFDFLLFDKVLIEYDGAYWHKDNDKKEVDAEKNAIAKKYGYTLIRVKDEESKDINTLIKIKKVINEILFSPNLFD